MKRLALALLAFTLCVAGASAQVIPPGTNPVPGGCAYFASGAPSPVSGSGFWLQCDNAGNLKIAGTFSATGGTTSNATSGVATSATNTGSVSYNYGFNGTTWDQLQVDASKFLKVNCATGCAGGTTSNAGSAVATSSTNGASVSWLYGFNGTTWDQLQVDGSKFLKVVLPSNQSINAVQWAGSTLGAPSNYGTSPGAVAVPGVNAFVTNTNPNGQATAANSSPTVLPAAQVTADPCTLGTKTNFTIATSSGTVQLVAPSGSTQVYICSLFTIGATASIQNIVGGTGASCTTGTPIAIAGSTTAASGMSFAVNGGFTFGNGGGTILRTTTAGHGVCLIQSATAAIAGGGTFVQQ